MKKHNRWGLIFVSPFIVGSLIFFVIPVIFSAYISFTKWDLFNPPEWVGFKNWIRVLNSPVVWIAFRNVFYFALIFVPLQTLFALIAAYLLNQQIRGTAIYRVIYFLPVVTPWVAASIVWIFLYNYDFGIINYLLKAVNLKPVNWLTGPNWWVVIGSIALINVWKGMGQSMVMILAGMQNVPTEVTEAAIVDGASRTQIFRHIIVPLVSPTIFLVMILSSISAFTAFDVFLTILGTGVADRNNVVNLLIYNEAFQNNKMGTASAMAWLLFVVILIITTLQKKYEKRWVHYEN